MFSSLIDYSLYLIWQYHNFVAKHGVNPAKPCHELHVVVNSHNMLQLKKTFSKNLIQIVDFINKDFEKIVADAAYVNILKCQWKCARACGSTTSKQRNQIGRASCRERV